jgi:hypothetical protein
MNSEELYRATEHPFLFANIFLMIHAIKIIDKILPKPSVQVIDYKTGKVLSWQREKVVESVLLSNTSTTH